MKNRSGPFNIYFVVLLSAALLASSACKTTEEKKQSKEFSTLRFHLEVNADGTHHSSAVPVFRERPVLVNVSREPLLIEGDVLAAAVVDAAGGFAIQVQFDRHGSLVLDNTTTMYKGQRLAIHSQFGDSRWLGAPLITRRIPNGLFVFTPDASREEAERIVRGLNNVAKKLKKKPGS